MSSTRQRRTSSKNGTLYFAYGSNLAVTQMQQRCEHQKSSSVPVAVARLDGYKWIISKKGYATVVKLPVGTPVSDESTVWGLVYDMQDKDVDCLDLYEGHYDHEPDNLKSQPNPDPRPDQRKKVPFLQGQWSYNKHYLSVAVTKWLASSPLQPGKAGQDEGIIIVLVYVDENETNEGKINFEYISRMNRAIEESARLGVPVAWMDKIMRKPGWVSRDRSLSNGIDASRDLKWKNSAVDSVSSRNN